MEFPRAHLYQSTLQAFFAKTTTSPVITVVHPSAPVLPFPVFTSNSCEPDQQTAPSAAGRTAGDHAASPIDVDVWVAQQRVLADPIDVDALPDVPAPHQESHLTVRSASHCLSKSGMFACGICTDTFKNPVV
ncbi:hypothetical protein C8R46DRAFT_1212613 [Mycena filopes]|nr:hypothetical protein C8R46DRAFT_1212613 [Mycena filopes]